MSVSVAMRNRLIEQLQKELDVKTNWVSPAQRRRMATDRAFVEFVESAGLDSLLARVRRAYEKRLRAEEEYRQAQRELLNCVRAAPDAAGGTISHYTGYHPTGSAIKAYIEENLPNMDGCYNVPRLLEDRIAPAAKRYQDELMSQYAELDRLRDRIESEIALATTALQVEKKMMELRKEIEARVSEVDKYGPRATRNVRVRSETETSDTE